MISNKVLLVEDSEPDAFLIRKYLEGQNFQVDCAPTGVKAMEFMGSVNYKCLVVDYKLPGMTGIELIRKLRVFASRVGIVILTGAPELVENECDGLDVWAVVGKGVRNGELHEKILEAIEFGEMPIEKLDKYATEIHTQTLRLKEIHQPGLDAPGLAT